MKIYVASSWRNQFQQTVVEALRKEGHTVYDFRNPGPGKRGFAWSEIDVNWEHWTPETYRLALMDDVAERGFQNDYNAMKESEVCVLVLPCGRSAHTEAGWMAGRYRKVYVLMLTKEEPELMYKLYDDVCLSIDELITELRRF